MPSAHVASMFASTTVTTTPDVSVGHLFLQMVIAIAVVGGGIWLFGKFLQRRRAGTLMAGKGTMRGLSVLSRTSLGKDHLVAVVAWRDRELLIGVSGSTITLLADSNEPVAPTALTSNADLDEDLDELMATVPATRAMAVQKPPTTGRPNFLEALRAATLRG